MSENNCDDVTKYNNHNKNNTYVEHNYSHCKFNNLLKTTRKKNKTSNSIILYTIITNLIKFVSKMTSSFLLKPFFSNVHYD